MKLQPKKKNASESCCNAYWRRCQDTWMKMEAPPACVCVSIYKRMVAVFTVSFHAPRNSKMSSFYALFKLDSANIPLESTFAIVKVEEEEFRFRTEQALKKALLWLKRNCSCVVKDQRTGTCPFGSGQRRDA